MRRATDFESSGAPGDIGSIFTAGVFRRCGTVRGATPKLVAGFRHSLDHFVRSGRVIQRAPQFGDCLRQRLIRARERPQISCSSASLDTGRPLRFDETHKEIADSRLQGQRVAMDAKRPAGPRFILGGANGKLVVQIGPAPGLMMGVSNTVMKRFQIFWSGIFPSWSVQI